MCTLMVAHLILATACCDHRLLLYWNFYRAESLQPALSTVGKARDRTCKVKILLLLLSHCMVHLKQIGQRFWIEKSKCLYIYNHNSCADGIFFISLNTRDILKKKLIARTNISIFFLSLLAKLRTYSWFGTQNHHALGTVCNARLWSCAKQITYVLCYHTGPSLLNS